MNKLHNLLALALISAPGVLYAQEKEFILKGKVPSDSKIIKLYIISSNKTDSATVTNGTFEYRSVVKKPTSGLIIRDKFGKGFKSAVGSESGVAFYKEPGEIFMDLPESGEFAIVKGGKTNQELQAYNKLVADDYNQGIAILTKLQNAKDQEEASPLIKKRRDVFTHMNLLGLNFAKEHPDSYVALDKAYLITRMESSVGMLKKADSVYNGFTNELKQTEPGIAFKNLIPTKMGIAMGGQAHDFTAVDSLGHMISLKSLRGKYVLLDFWASWCGPCRQENPNVVKAFEQYKNKNFLVVAVSLDKKEGRGKWLKAVKDDKLPYLQLWDPEGQVAKQYMISSIPQNYLINPEGKIIAINLTGEVLMKNLAKVLDK